MAAGGYGTQLISSLKIIRTPVVLLLDVQHIH